MTKRRTAAMVVILAAVALVGCARSTPLWLKRGGPPRVVVTIPALDSFVRNVGGEHVGIVCLCTAKGPHLIQLPRAAGVSSFTPRALAARRRARTY